MKGENKGWRENLCGEVVVRRKERFGGSEGHFVEDVCGACQPSMIQK